MNAAEFFFPFQVGVGVKGGSEIALKSMSEVISRYGNVNDQELLMLKLDFKNAFNLVDRSVFVKKIK